MATKRADGRWQEQVTIVENGQRKQKYFYGKTKAEVLRKIAAYKDETKDGPLFSAVADDYWEAALETLADNTQSGYRPALNRAKDFFGSTRITMIAPIDVRRFMDQFIEEHNPARKTAATQRQLLRNIFGYAFDKGYIDSNPADGLKIKKSLAKKERTLPTDAEIKAIKENYDKPFGLVAYWILYTGLRRGELLALTWEDVDLENNFITVNKSLYRSKKTGKLAVKNPKTEKGIRTVPLMSALKAKITPGTGKVFCNADGSYITEKQFECRWGKYTKELGIDCTPHQLRHGYATMLLDNNIDPKDAQELLGHAQLSTTMDIYTHIREARKKRVRDKLIDVDFDV